MPINGVKPEVTGFPALASWVITRFPFLSAASQTHPDPNTPVPAFLNSDLKLSNDPHFLFIASAIFPSGIFFAFGENC